MIKQDGILVILVNKFKTFASTHPGIYYIVKVGKECLRFNTLMGELAFQVEQKEGYLPIEIFMFQRRTRLSNSCIGRRRDLLDHVEESYFYRQPSKFNDSRVEWKSIEVNFPNQPVYFSIDVEFYPRVPILPLKDGKCNVRIEKSDKIEPPNNFVNPSKPHAKIRKRDRMISTINQLNIDALKGNKSRAASFEDTIYHDIKKVHNGDTLLNNYEHGDGSTKPFFHEDVSGPIKSTEVYHMIKMNQHKVTNEILQLDISPQQFFMDIENRLEHNQGMNFVNMFPTNNIRLTGYLGRGKWGTTMCSETMMNWYLQSGVDSLPPPPLPPKCPQRMLWEECYLIEKDLYISNVLR